MIPVHRRRLADLFHYDISTMATFIISWLQNWDFYAFPKKEKGYKREAWCGTDLECGNENSFSDFNSISLPVPTKAGFKQIWKEIVWNGKCGTNFQTCKVKRPNVLLPFPSKEQTDRGLYIEPITCCPPSAHLCTICAQVGNAIFTDQHFISTSISPLQSEEENSLSLVVCGQ